MFLCYSKTSQFYIFYWLLVSTCSWGELKKDLYSFCLTVEKELFSALYAPHNACLSIFEQSIEWPCRRCFIFPWNKFLRILVTTYDACFTF